MKQRILNAAKIIASDKILARAISHLLSNGVSASAYATKKFTGDADVAVCIALAAAGVPLYYVPKNIANQAVVGLKKLIASKSEVGEKLFDRAVKILARMTAKEALELLEVPAGEGSDKSKLKKLYRQAAHRHHPDRGGSTEAMQRVNEAYALLKKGGFDSGGIGSGDNFESYEEARIREGKEFVKMKNEVGRKIDKDFNASSFTDYLEKTAGKPFKMKVKKKEQNLKDFGLTYMGHYLEWSSEDGETVFSLDINPTSSGSRAKSLGGDDVLELDLQILPEILHGAKKSKFKKTK